MGWFVLIVAVVGIAPVFVMMLWAFGKEVVILHKEELALQRRTREVEDRLFECFIQDPNKRVLSRGKAAVLIGMSSAMAAWPFALIGWALARHVGATIGAVLVIPPSIYGYAQIRRLPRRVERARRISQGASTVRHA